MEYNEYVSKTLGEATCNNTRIRFLEMNLIRARSTRYAEQVWTS